ncbi:hypothetical protein LT493_23750 [Streptomyces tricolor]|nr:hypothetical protein [Streptomyces tricolor]
MRGEPSRGGSRTRPGRVHDDSDTLATALPWERAGTRKPPASWRRRAAALRHRVLARTRAGTTLGRARDRARHRHPARRRHRSPQGIEELYHHRRLSLDLRLAVLLGGRPAHGRGRRTGTRSPRCSGGADTPARGAGRSGRRTCGPCVVNAARSVLRRRRTVRAHTRSGGARARPERTSRCTRTAGRCWRRCAR